MERLRAKLEWQVVTERKWARNRRENKAKKGSNNNESVVTKKKKRDFWVSGLRDFQY